MIIIIDFAITGQHIRRTDNIKVIANSRNILYARFAFSGWDDVTKTAIFIGSDNVAYKMLIGDDGTCLVPSEVIKSPRFAVSVYGGDLMTTNFAQVYVMSSGYRADAGNGSAPTPDIYYQICQTVSAERQQASVAASNATLAATNVQNVADVVSKELADGSFVGPQGPQGIPGQQGIPGEKGQGFSIAKTYASIAEMTASGGAGLNANDFVLIDTGDVNNPENSRLYRWGGTEFVYLTDLSGAPGIQGERGLQGLQGVPGEQGIPGQQGTPGVQGIDGKSAYQAATSGGYTGTEADFNVAMSRAKELPVYLTQSQYDALTPDANTTYVVVPD